MTVSANNFFALLEPYNQLDITKMMNHINSFARKSIGGLTPYTLAKMTMPKDFFILLGLEEIPADDVILEPSLLNR